MCPARSKNQIDIFRRLSTVDREEIAEMQRHSRALAEKVRTMRAEHELQRRVSQALINQSSEIEERIIAAQRVSRRPSQDDQPKAKPMAIGARHSWNVRFYQLSADRFRKDAAASRNAPDVRDRLLRIAERFEHLALSAAAAGAYGDQNLRPVGGREDNLSQARRHVAEAEAHITRQQALVAKLSADKRLAAAAELAKKVLETLTHTRNIACQHVEEHEQAMGQ